MAELYNAMQTSRFMLFFASAFFLPHWTVVAVYFVLPTFSDSKQAILFWQQFVCKVKPGEPHAFWYMPSCCLLMQLLFPEWSMTFPLWIGDLWTLRAFWTIQLIFKWEYQAFSLAKPYFQFTIFFNTIAKCEYAILQRKM